MKHLHGLARHSCLTAKSCSLPASLYRAGKVYPVGTLYRTHANTAAATTGFTQVASVTQEHDNSVDRSRRFEHAPPFSSFLTDTHSRQHTYLRISLTERCNLRCTYCMPEAGVPLSPQSTQLTTSEILLLSSLFVSQGVNKIRLTGGEPTVRKDIVSLMQQLGDLRSMGLKELCITSNGIVLKNKLESMHKAGLTGVNLSLDTLDPGLFMIMTRRRGFERVIDTMERILEMNRLGAGIDLKINVVVMKGVNDSEILRFIELGRDKNLEVRFIEYMPFDENRWARNKMVTFQDMLHIIQQKYPDLEKVTDRKGDTSKKYQVPGFVGRIGFITSMTNNFCASCNRLRITSDGNLKVCLFGNTEVSLRDLIRKENHGQPIDEAAFAAMKSTKSANHQLSYVGGQEHENELLQAIGQAVGRKKAQHAGMGVLEKTKNRPMILIGG